MSCRNPFLICASLVLSLAAGTCQAEGRDPETIFNTICFSCHGTGWDNAPVIGDTFAWEERIEQGMPTLIKNTLDGINAMPPKGACDDCTDAELEAVVKWLVNQE